MNRGLEKILRTIKDLQEEIKKEYVAILPGIKVGALPKVSVSPLTFDVKQEQGRYL